MQVLLSSGNWVSAVRSVVLLREAVHDFFYNWNMLLLLSSPSRFFFFLLFAAAACKFIFWVMHGLKMFCAFCAANEKGHFCFPNGSACYCFLCWFALFSFEMICLNDSTTFMVTFFLFSYKRCCLTCLCLVVVCGGLQCFVRLVSRSLRKETAMLFHLKVVAKQ